MKGLKFLWWLVLVGFIVLANIYTDLRIEGHVNLVAPVFFAACFLAWLVSIPGKKSNAKGPEGSGKRDYKKMFWLFTWLICLVLSGLSLLTIIYPNLMAEDWERAVRVILITILAFGSSFQWKKIQEEIRNVNMKEVTE